MAGIIFGMLLLFAYWIAFILDASPLQFMNTPFPVEGPITLDEPFTFEIELCSARATGYTFTQSVLDEDGDKVMALQGVSTVANKGCDRFLSREKVISGELAPGMYRIQMEVTSMGRLRQFTQVVQTQLFEVTE